jgi:hypothetical protein
MNSMDKEFIAEAYSLIVQIEELIKKYEYEDRVMSTILIGVMIKDIMTMQYKENNSDLDQLLGDLGISLN